MLAVGHSRILVTMSLQPSLFRCIEANGYVLCKSAMPVPWRDTPENNEVNFAILHFLGYQFAPRYKDIYDIVRASLYGFNHPSRYGDILIKPMRKIWWRKSGKTFREFYCYLDWKLQHKVLSLESSVSNTLTYGEMEQDSDMLKRIAPVEWQQINLYGRYEFNKKQESIDMTEIIQKLIQSKAIPGVDLK